jgi:hypothetical protein
MGPAKAAVDALVDFKNPFNTGTVAVTEGATADGGTASASKGNTVVSNTTTNVYVSTCLVEGCAEIKANTIAID